MLSKKFARVSEFSLVSASSAKQTSLDQTGTTVTRAENSGILNPEMSPFNLAVKRSASKRANRGVNPKYDSEIYLGQTGTNINQSELCETLVKPFTLPSESSKDQQSCKRVNSTKPKRKSFEDQEQCDEDLNDSDDKDESEEEPANKKKKASSLSHQVRAN